RPPPSTNVVCRHFHRPYRCKPRAKCAAQNFFAAPLFISGHQRYRCSVNEEFNLAVVVDDDPDIALAAKLALRDMFERIEALSSPAELLTLLEKQSPDAILLDLNFRRAATDGRERLD